MNAYPVSESVPVLAARVGFSQILVPIDFSETSKAALVYDVSLADVCGASLHLLHVLEAITGDLTGWEISARLEIGRAIETSAWQDLRRLLPIEEQERLHVHLVVTWGMPVFEIVRYANAEHVDLIAMGTHGRSGIKHLVMGSVAESVVRQAPCPVLTVRRQVLQAVRRSQAPATIL